jgi:hypothetical protein
MKHAEYSGEVKTFFTSETMRRILCFAKFYSLFLFYCLDSDK